MNGLDAQGSADPACNLVLLWTLFLFTEEGRATFQTGVSADVGMQARVQGRALRKALVHLREIRKVLAKTMAAQRVLNEVLEDHKAAQVG